MTAERVLPEGPLAFIRQCVRQRQLCWTYHINICLRGRFFARQHIVDAVDTYEIIVKGLPVRQCASCTEYVLEALVMDQVERILGHGDTAAELEVIEFVA